VPIGTRIHFVLEGLRAKNPTRTKSCGAWLAGCGASPETEQKKGDAQRQRTGSLNGRFEATASRSTSRFADTARAAVHWQRKPEKRSYDLVPPARGFGVIGIIALIASTKPDQFMHGTTNRVV